MFNHSRNLILGIAIAVTAFSCSKTDSSTSSSGTTTETTTTNPDPIDVTTCASATGIAKIICLADAFKSQLTSTQLATVQRTYSKTEAQKWSNLPQSLYVEGLV